MRGMGQTWRAFVGDLPGRKGAVRRGAERAAEAGEIRAKHRLLCVKIP